MLSCFSLVRQSIARHVPNLNFVDQTSVGQMLSDQKTRNLKISIATVFYPPRHNDTQHNDIHQNDIQHNDIQQNDTQHNDIQQNDSIMALNTVMLSDV
jgi:hypothetical protein